MVVDASIFGPLLLPDEDVLPQAVVVSLAQAPLTAPAHWPLETIGLLQSAVKRRRITVAEYEEALKEMSAFGVTVASDTHRHAWAGVSRLAVEQGLTIYDAAYLEQAHRLGASLATLDSDLVDAAVRLGVPVLTR